MKPEAIEAASKLLNIRSEAKKMLERELDTDDEMLELQIVGVFEGTKPHSTISGSYTHILGCLPSAYLRYIADHVFSDAVKKLEELGVEI